MKNMKNIQTWTPVAFVLLQHRNKGTRVLFHPGIGFGFNLELQKQFLEPDIINSELKCAFGYITGERMNTQSWLLVCWQSQYVFWQFLVVIGKNKSC
jgi:hypothetical protein